LYHLSVYRSDYDEVSKALPKPSSNILPEYNWDISLAKDNPYLPNAGSHNRHILLPYRRQSYVEIKKASSAWHIKNDKGSSDSHY
jgi:hypothetical protein